MSCTQEPRYPICKSAPTIFLDSKKKQMTDKSTSTFEISAAGQIYLSRVIKSASEIEIGSVHNYDTKSMCESFLSAQSLPEGTYCNLQQGIPKVTAQMLETPAPRAPVILHTIDFSSIKALKHYLRIYLKGASFLVVFCTVLRPKQITKLNKISETPQLRKAKSIVYFLYRKMVNAVANVVPKYCAKAMYI